MPATVNLCWLRRDLRLLDHAALYHALKSEHPVVPVFVFDTVILNDLEDKYDRRVTFIRDTLEEMQEKLAKLGSSLDVFYGTPEEAFAYYTTQYHVQAVYANIDYEPYARNRDKAVAKLLKEKKIGFNLYKDQVIFDRDEVLKDNGEPYTVYTPYSKKWKAKLNDFHLKPYPVENYFRNLYKQKSKRIPSLRSMGFMAGERDFPALKVKDSLIQNYDKTRDLPGIHGTTHFGMHLRFGTISVRELADRANHLNQTFLGELIWRDFFHMILWHYPHVVEHSFRGEYDKIKWRNNEAEFKKWCDGETGYPIVDAGMREMNATGFMHNRVRMVTASFLTKHLLIDWRWGEAYFAGKLLDYDLAANNGNWQWAAGCGCDAAPYFRVFNPSLQTERFDPDLTYVRKWVPELDELTYPRPMVIHEEARKRALEVYKKAVAKT
ncbi:cryptochrome/photolyase family protein [Chitinophaga sancti]|uniref:Deoxyribodipyrimidine photo-lyase n=1 Tax=Chitinophaga sancti TaxID=1004 RepID=A0A1K1PES1_9BACT|nr:deoxyribodipyrimidine photo-lyase [Chitinophaga sancti]WQD65742.1 deoxyribodipyrimidine photo-lyase [Chitinophaga sancti]WQG88636.1 deoxyribodipyrimidine photo-lyase [Chitinophaga sancti]SFW45158.1 deoxyribodipyrimidine photo-lyase [Chitinophaga sancti]